MSFAKRIIIICEGRTENEFCKKVLEPHLNEMNIHIQAPLIKKSRGGIVSWHAFKKQIEKHLNQEKDVVVTQLMDYYGIEAKHQFPSWKERNRYSGLIERIEMLEGAMVNDMPESFQHRYIPYLQLHEFEALLFSDINAFKWFDDEEFHNYDTFKKIFNDFDNPELINDNKKTCPSARLEWHIPGYNKVIYGSLIAEEIGLTKIRTKCTHFDSWVNKLERIE